MGRTGEITQAEQIGRGGVLIPETSLAHEYGYTVFFRDFFEINGFNLAQELDRKEPFMQEIVVPPSENKSLVIVRAQYEIESPDSLDHSDDFGYSTWKTIGCEKYSVLFPPEQAGQFDEYMKVMDDHVTGGGLSYPAERLEIAGYPISAHTLGLESAEAYKRARVEIVEKFIDLIS